MSINDYIEAHSTPVSSLLDRIERDTYWHAINPRMVCGAVEGQMLAFLSRMIKPKRILEIGTFTGYSALCLAQGLTEDGLLDTIERNDEMEDTIRRNIASERRISLHIGDALAIIPTLNACYDLVFIDGDKLQYPAYLDAVLSLCHPDSWILADNTLWDGHVIDPRYDKEPQTVALRRFNEKVKEDKRLEVVLLPIRDGLSVIRVL